MSPPDPCGDSWRSRSTIDRSACRRCWRLRRAKRFNARRLLLFFEIQKRIAVQHIAVDNERRDAAHIPRADRWVGIHYKDVCATAGRDKPQLIPVELQRVVVGGSRQRLARSETEPAQHLQLHV